MGMTGLAIMQKYINIFHTVLLCVVIATIIGCSDHHEVFQEKDTSQLYNDRDTAT